MTSKSFVAKASLPLLISIALLLSSSSLLQAQVQRNASVVEAKGKVEYQVAGQTNWKSARQGTRLKTGDSIRTAAGASAVISIESVAKMSMVKIDSGSEVKLSDLALEETTGKEQTLLDMTIGNILVDTKPKAGSQFQVKTPTSIIGARGTSFRVKSY